jgi:carbamoyl-phosphate synthase large subunit
MWTLRSGRFTLSKHGACREDSHFVGHARAVALCGAARRRGGRKPSIGALWRAKHRIVQGTPLLVRIWISRSCWRLGRGIEMAVDGIPGPADAGRERRRLRVLMTGCGARGLAVGTVAALRRSASFDVEVVGVDASPSAAGRFVVDRFHLVPRAHESDYLAEIARLVLEERIDVVLPLLDAELLKLSALPVKYPVVLAAPRLSVLELCLDKGSLLKELYARGLNPVPACTPTDAGQLASDALALGYPVHPLVAKPRRGSGARGVWLVCEQTGDDDDLFGRSSLRKITLAEFGRRAANVLREFVLMPFVEGEHYTVSCLNSRGSLVIIPVRRDSFGPGITWAGEVVEHTEVMGHVREVVKDLGLGPCANVQLAWDGRRSVIYEINPRLSTTSTVCAAAGVNLADALLHDCQARTYQPGPVRWGLRFSRYAADLVGMA